MERARKQLLAGSGFAEDEHGDRRRGDFFDRAARAQHCRVPRKNAGHRRRFLRCVQAGVFLLQLVNAKRAVDRPGQQLGLERLRAEVMRTEADRLQCICPVVLPGQYDHLGPRNECMQLRQQLESLGGIVGLRRKPAIHRDDSRLEPAHLRDRTGAVAGDDRLILVERPQHLLLECGIVLDNEQRLARHATCSSIITGPAAGSIAGISTRTHVPPPGRLSTCISPPSPFTYWALSYTPIPMPDGLVVWNGLNRRSRTNSGAIPAPVSETATATNRPADSTRTLTVLPDGLASIAFCTRCPITCSSRCSCPNAAAGVVETSSMGTCEPDFAAHTRRTTSSRSTRRAFSTGSAPVRNWSMSAFMRSTTCCTVRSISDWNAGLSRWRCAFFSINDNWVTRFFRSCTTNADMRLKASNFRASRSASDILTCPR